jgi:hypothetical protein
MAYGGITGMLLGHSFVVGTLHNLSPASRPSTRRLAALLHVNHTVNHIKLVGERGARITHPNFTLPEAYLRHYQPDFVILEYGTNDIVSGSDPLHIATTIVDLANTLLSTYGVDQVLICSILHRTRHLRNITPMQFKEKARAVNSYLRNMCADEPQLAFHVHQGFWSIPVHQWSRDGVHPNTTHGRNIYIKSIRKAIFLATGRLCNMLNN